MSLPHEPHAEPILLGIAYFFSLLYIHQSSLVIYSYCKHARDSRGNKTRMEAINTNIEGNALHDPDRDCHQEIVHRPSPADMLPKPTTDTALPSANDLKSSIKR